MTVAARHAPVAAPIFRTDAFINGRFVPAQSGRRFVAVNPATGQPLAEVASCDGKDVDLAVQAARTAFEDRRWAGLKPASASASWSSSPNWCAPPARIWRSPRR